MTAIMSQMICQSYPDVDRRHKTIQARVIVTMKRRRETKVLGVNQ